MGGELRPELQSKIFATDRSQYVLGDNKQPWNETVDTTHVSWLLNHYAFSGAPDATERFVTNVAEQRMGYELWVSRVEARQTNEGALVVSVTLGNAGVAPFYYNLTLSVEMELLAATGSRSTRSETLRVPRVLPGDTLQLLATIHDVTAPTWTSLSSISLSLQCPRCYAGRPVPLSNADRCDDRWHQALCRGGPISFATRVIGRAITHAVGLTITGAFLPSSSATSASSISLTWRNVLLLLLLLLFIKSFFCKFFMVIL